MWRDSGSYIHKSEEEQVTIWSHQAGDSPENQVKDQEDGVVSHKLID